MINSFDVTIYLVLRVAKRRGMITMEANTIGKIPKVKKSKTIDNPNKITHGVDAHIQAQLDCPTIKASFGISTTSL
tara:strand:- start:399 stop:626 length:228 start_codon:yes stop_codon:yes gene_type:complete